MKYFNLTSLNKNDNIIRMVKVSVKIIFLFLIITSVICFLQTNYKTEEYTLKKDNKTIILFGMTHIADCDFFNYFKSKYVNRNEFFFITEGITDRNKLLTGSNELKYTYIPLPNLCEQKKEIIFSRESSENGDIDFSELSEESRSRLIDLLTKSRYESFKQNIISPMMKNYIIKNDFLNKRNEKVYKKITQSDKMKIVIPWGNQHISGILSKLQSDGYMIINKKTHKPFLFFK